MSAYPSARFQGWLGHGPDSVNGKMQWGEFEPKIWTEDDVDIHITHCGVCGSDMHTLSSGWGATRYPCVVGHEIVGKAVRVGTNVKNIKVGDRVGVGPQARSCLQADCRECSQLHENYCCRGSIFTYAGQYPNNEGYSYGGYARHNRTHGRFVFAIPDELDSATAAALLCGGVTAYAPLLRHGCGPGKTVGVVGIGALGHLSVLMAKLLGANVVAISRSTDKMRDALESGAQAFIATDSDSWVEDNRRSLDLILCTSPSEHMPLGGYLKLLKVHGTLVQVGFPDLGRLPQIMVGNLIDNGVSIEGSAFGSPAETRKMLEMVAAQKLSPRIEERPMKDANQVLVDMEQGKARFKYVLVNEEEGGSCMSTSQDQGLGAQSV